MDRRAFLRGALAAPAVVLTQGLLMPVRYVGWDLGTHDASVVWGVDENGKLFSISPPPATVKALLRMSERARDEMMRTTGWERMK